MSNRKSQVLLGLSIISLLVACSRAPSKKDIADALSIEMHQAMKAKDISDTMATALAPKVSVKKYSCKAAKVGYSCDVTAQLTMSTGSSTHTAPMHIVKGPHGWRILRN